MSNPPEGVYRRPFKRNGPTHEPAEAEAGFLAPAPNELTKTLKPRPKAERKAS